MCTKEVQNYLRSLAGDLHVVRGDFDEVRAPGRALVAAISGGSAAGRAERAATRPCLPRSMPPASPQDGGLPESKVVSIGAFRIGLVHGHQLVPWGDAEVLATVRRQLDVDILVSGHTHAFKAHSEGGKLFLNPGSATGAAGPITPCARGRARLRRAAAVASAAPCGVRCSPACATLLRLIVAPPAAFCREPVPSFVLLDLQGSKATTYVYELVNGEVGVKKIDHEKQS